VCDPQEGGWEGEETKGRGKPEADSEGKRYNEVWENEGRETKWK